MSLKRAYFLLVLSNLTFEVNNGQSQFSSALCRLAVKYGCVFNYYLLGILVSILRRFQTYTMVIGSGLKFVLSIATLRIVPA